MKHKPVKLLNFLNFRTFLVTLFFLVCLIPSVGMLLFGPSDANANEIRSPLPELIASDGSFNTDFLSGLTDWFDDRFQLRPELSTAWAKLNAALFRTSVEDSVILGSGGWLYYADSLEDYTGVLLPEETVDAAAENLFRISQRCEELGMDFVFTVAPNKSSLYPDNMPAVYPRGECSNVRRLYDKLDELGVPYADLHAAFSAQEEILYFRTDSHWNTKGAALAADAVLSTLGRTSDFYNASFETGETHTGDLYEMLYPSGVSAEKDLRYTPGFTFTALSSPRSGEAINFSTESASGTGRLFCWRDSFGNSLYPFFAESFASAEFSRENPYDLSKLESGKEKYDVVLIEIVERNISWLA